MQASKKVRPGKQTIIKNVAGNASDSETEDWEDALEQLSSDSLGAKFSQKLIHHRLSIWRLLRRSGSNLRAKLPCVCLLQQPLLEHRGMNCEKNIAAINCSLDHCQLCVCILRKMTACT